MYDVHVHVFDHFDCPALSYLHALSRASVFVHENQAPGRVNNGLPRYQFIRS
jgi:hypothetical protein